MLLFWEEKLAFLATPKAGSTAIESALEPLSSVALQRPAPLKHLTAAAFSGHMQPLLEATSGARFETVALIREPVDWVRSWFRFRQRDDHDDPDHPMAGRSFEQFVTDILAPAPPPHAEISSQAAFLCDASGKPGVDHLFVYERIDGFLAFLEERLGCEIHLPRLNVPPAVDTRLSEATETRLRQHLVRDLDIYRGLL